MEENRKPFTFLFSEVAREYQLQVLKISLSESLTPAELRRNESRSPSVPPAAASPVLGLGNNFYGARE